MTAGLPATFAMILLALTLVARAMNERSAAVEPLSPQSMEMIGFVP